MKWLVIAWRNVLRNRRRALTTIAITAIAVTSILLGGGFANYTYNGLREMAARDSGHLLFAHKDFFAKDEDTAMQYGLTDHAALAEAVSQNKGIRYVLPRISF